MNNKYIDLHKDISLALKNNKPIVALESSLISHGLPYPENVKVANTSIDVIKESGSIPATIAIIKGRIKIGLYEEDIEFLAKNKKVEKVSRHNLALSLSNKTSATTTVASTIFIASKLGIKFFATGGIGGVHIDSENTLDVSSDLYELSQSSMYVVCSGAKSILDLDKTYEKLETLGIARIGFNTDFMPGFWYYQTNKKVDYNFSDINKLTCYLQTRENIEQNNSVLIFNTVPKDKSIDKNKVNSWINSSIKKAKLNKVYGKDLTPFLIKEINILSQNKSLKANIALIIDNARLAGKLAANFQN